MKLSNSLLILILTLTISGCTTFKKQLGVVQPKLAEASRVLTTATVDALILVPATNRVDAVVLATDLAKQNQLIIGLPEKSLNVKPLLSTNTMERVASRAALAAMFAEQQVTLGQVRVLESQLIEMGAKYEAEKNASIVHRCWTWFKVTLGLGTIGAIIALCIMFPVIGAVVLPILGRILGWLVKVAPTWASYIGVVGHKAFDSVVGAFEKGKAGADPVAVAQITSTMSKEMDKSDKALVKESRNTLLQKEASIMADNVVAGTAPVTDILDVPKYEPHIELVRVKNV